MNGRLADLPRARARLAQMRIETDRARAHLTVTIDAVEHPSAATQLLVLEAKAAANEAVIAVTDLAMQTCGGSALHRGLGIERLFRDARAPIVMAPTSDQAQEFIGRALCGMEVLMSAPLIIGAVLYDPKVTVIWDIIRDFFDANGCPIDVVFYTNYELQVSGLLVDIWTSRGIPTRLAGRQRRSGGRCRPLRCGTPTATGSPTLYFGRTGRH